MRLRLRLVLLLMLPLLLVSGVYSVVRVQQEARARVADEHARAAGMARTIQIAVENALAVRGRPHAELAGLLDDLTLGQRGSIGFASSTGMATCLPPRTRERWHSRRRLDAVARVIETGTGVVVERQGRDRRLVGVRPARPVFRSTGPGPLTPHAGRAGDRLCRPGWRDDGSPGHPRRVAAGRGVDGRAGPVDRRGAAASGASPVGAAGPFDPRPRRGPPRAAAARQAARRARRIGGGLQPHDGAPRRGASARGGGGRARLGPRAAAAPGGDPGRGREARLGHRARGRHAAEHHLRARRDGLGVAAP